MSTEKKPGSVRPGFESQGSQVARVMLEILPQIPDNTSLTASESNVRVALPFGPRHLDTPGGGVFSFLRHKKEA